MVTQVAWHAVHMRDSGMLCACVRVCGVFVRMQKFCDEHPECVQCSALCSTHPQYCNSGQKCFQCANFGTTSGQASALSMASEIAKDKIIKKCCTRCAYCYPNCNSCWGAAYGHS